MIRKVILVLLAALLTAWPLGCVSAPTTTEVETPQDILVGIFITFDDITPSIAPVQSGSSGTESANDTVIGRIDADVTLDEHDEIVSCRFSGLEGIPFYYIWQFPGETDIEQDIKSWNSITSTSSFLTVYGEEIDEPYLIVDNDINLSGKIYYIDLIDAPMLFFNKVYQSQDNEVYLIAGEQLSRLDKDEWTLVFSQAISQLEDTQSGIGPVSSVAVNIGSIDRPVRYVIKQMDGHDDALTAVVVDEETLPDIITVLPEADYILIETVGLDKNGLEVTNRTILESDAESFTFLFESRHSIATGIKVPIEYP